MFKKKKVVSVDCFKISQLLHLFPELSKVWLEWIFKVFVEESSHDHQSFASDDILFHFSSKNINLCFSNATKITIQTCL